MSLVLNSFWCGIISQFPVCLCWWVMPSPALCNSFRLLNKSSELSWCLEWWIPSIPLSVMGWRRRWPLAVVAVSGLVTVIADVDGPQQTLIPLPRRLQLLAEKMQQLTGAKLVLQIFYLIAPAGDRQYMQQGMRLVNHSWCLMAPVCSIIRF